MKIKSKLATIAALLLTLLFCVACSTRRGEIPSGYEAIVTYCFNGGKMSSYASTMTELTVHYQKGSKVAEPGVTTSELEAVTREGYSVGGWYYAEMNENGEPVRGEDGNVVASDRRFDFSSDRVENNIWLVVRWAQKVRVYFENLYIYEGIQYRKDYETGQAFTQPETTSVMDGVRRDIEGYYWSYDEETDTYSDRITFDGLTFDDLFDHLPEDPEKEGDYSVLRIYVKLAPAKEPDSSAQ